MTGHPLVERTEWRRWMVPKGLHSQPIHRWFVFPHSFTGELVHALIDEWGLGPDDRVLDPFVGAGTTLLAAREKGLSAAGYDLSPLSELATRVKITDYRGAHLTELWSHLRRGIDPRRWNDPAREYPELVCKALPGKLLGAFDALDLTIASLEATNDVRDFFRLALLSTIPEYSRAIAGGGWLKWVEKQNSVSDFYAAFTRHVSLMLQDLDSALWPEGASWTVGQADARSLPDHVGTYSAVITSPPYPNRHDYTRVFGVELMFGFLDWEQTRQLRYQSFHSHPEAHPMRPKTNGYDPLDRLNKTIDEIREKEENSRVIRMLKGYFLDLYITLREVYRVCRRDAKVAFVVGNAQYRGVPVAVDEFTAEIGEQAGLNTHGRDQPPRKDETDRSGNPPLAFCAIMQSRV